MADNQLSPFLVVGLGNPGPEYHRTHHNLGFEVVDLLAAQAGPSVKFRQKFQSEYVELTWAGRKVLAIKPMTFMNLSGQAVGEFVRFYKSDPNKDLLVITDDLDLPRGKLRLRLGGGAGGHNGLKSIISHLGTEAFPRLRIGIGRSETVSGEDHVLAKIGTSAWKEFVKPLEKAGETVKLVPAVGVPKAMNFCNTDGEKSE